MLTYPDSFEIFNFGEGNVKGDHGSRVTEGVTSTFVSERDATGVPFRHLVKKKD